MSLSSGAKLGPYEIVGPLGAGGMGEVYRARDTRLGRTVAVKVLPTDLLASPVSRERFEREARTISQLSHPRICALYDVGDHEGSPFLVMELLEGQTLAARLEKGWLPIEEVLRYGAEICEALVQAHRQGIVHRDLKPGNVMLTKQGVKLLDFGLAQAIQPLGPQLDQLGPTEPFLTGEGEVVGTPQYMSPEQIEGRPLDARSDIFALGVVIYRMVTGRHAFSGSTAPAMMGAVLKDIPSRVSQVRPEAPPALDRLIAACLAKDPNDRVQSAHDVMLQLQWIAESATAPAMSSLAAPEQPAWRRAIAPGLLLLTLALGGIAVWRLKPSGNTAITRTVVMLTGAAATLEADPRGQNIALSPDGKTLAFVGREAGDSRVFVRKLDQLQATSLAGTEGASRPVFSPDGQWIAFVQSGVLRKVRVSGGAVIRVGEALAAYHGGVAWTEDDMIIFSSVVAGVARLMGVPAAGGTPAIFGTPIAGVTTQKYPQALPGSKGVLYTENASPVGFEGATLVIAPRSGGTPKIVVRGAYFGRYVPGGLASPSRGDGGHLIYIRRGTLFAVRFDLDRLETIGAEVPVLEGLATSSQFGSAHLAVSSEGTLAYLPAAFATADYPIDWMTRDGKSSVLRATRAEWANPRFSPDGKKLAIDISDGKQTDIWVYEWARDTLTQLTFDKGSDSWPVWTPDGRRIVFGSDRAQSGVPNMYWVNADGTGEVTRLHESPRSELPLSWHRSGKFLVYSLKTGGATGSDSMILPMEGDVVRGFTPGKPYAFLNTPESEVYSMFSPDGRWIAYVVAGAGGSAPDVYVRPFPGPGGPWRISTESGVMPDWSASGHELLFLNLKTNTIMFVNYSVAGDSFRADKPQVFQPTSFMPLEWGNRRFAIHPDGKRLALVAKDPSDVKDKVALFFNFGGYLQTLTAGKK